jgi:hypothetical protein
MTEPVVLHTGERVAVMGTRMCGRLLQRLVGRRLEALSVLELRSRNVHPHVGRESELKYCCGNAVGMTRSGRLRSNSNARYSAIDHGRANINPDRIGNGAVLEIRAAIEDSSVLCGRTVTRRRFIIAKSAYVVLHRLLAGRRTSRVRHWCRAASGTTVRSPEEFWLFGRAR